MNKRDTANLNFIMNSSEETLDEWYQHCSDDDLAYAKELMTTYGQELAAKQTRAMIAVMDLEEPEMIDEVTLNYLRRFTSTTLQ